MSHATDGELHAYLDGGLGDAEPRRAEQLAAHLELCADCRARLEQTEAVRRRAGEILGMVAPAGEEIPPFERVQAAAAADAPTPAVSAASPAAPRSARGAPWSSGWRASGLAWAASIALALLAGWQGRAWVGTGEPVQAARNEELAAAPAEQETREASTGDRPTYADAAGARRERQVEPAAPLAAEADAKLGEGGEAVRTEGARAVAEPASRGRETDPALRDQVAGQATDVNRAARRVSGADESPPPTQPAREAEAGEVEAPLTRQRLGAAAVEGRGALEAKPEPAAADAPPPADAFAQDTATAEPAWLVVGPASAEHWLGGTVLRVPDLPLEELAIAELDGERAVRVRQRLPSGEPLELVEVRAGEIDEALAAPRLDDDRRLNNALKSGRLAARVGELWVTASAAVAADSLRALLSRLR